MSRYVRSGILTRRCILRSGHSGYCEWNNYDVLPDIFYKRCRGSLAEDENGVWILLISSEYYE